MDLERLHQRARERRASPVVYGIVRLTFQPFFHLYFRFQRIGRRYIPRRGPVIIASNHRSFLDPFVIACMARRPMYYVAKKEIFLFNRVLSWLLAALGAFPVDRGASDADMIATAKAILARGDIVLIFPEGTRIRPGALARPRRGVGRLALETGVPVVPLAVHGTEAVRRGWRIRPHKVRIRAGRPLRFPHVEQPSPALARAVTERIWPCVMLQWEWLGGTPPARRAAVIGAGSGGRALAACLARAGLEVVLGCRTPAELDHLGELPHEVSELPQEVRVTRASDLALADHDLVVLAVTGGELPGVLAAHGPGIPPQAGVLVVSDGLVPPLGTLPSAYVAEHCAARAVAVLAAVGPAADAPEDGRVIVASADKALARQITDILRAAGLEATRIPDVTGVELARCARDMRALADASGGPAAAGQVLAEIAALALAKGGRPETLRDMQAAAEGRTVRDLAAQAGLLARAARAARVSAPALERLAASLEAEGAPSEPRPKPTQVA